MGRRPGLRPDPGRPLKRASGWPPRAPPPILLGRWGLLDGREATSYPPLRHDQLGKAKVLPEARAVADGNSSPATACGSAFGFRPEAGGRSFGEGRLPMLSTTSSTTVAEDKAAPRRQVRLTLEGLSPGGGPPRRRRPVRRLLRPSPRQRPPPPCSPSGGILGREPDTGRLIRALTARGKRVGLPRDAARPTDGGAAGRAGPPPGPGVLRDPGAASGRPLLARPDIDLALVPAVCWDRRGFRLGFGGGYYDRWLSGFSGFTVGLCRDCVLQDRVPTEDHDCRVDLLLTETRRFLR